MPHGPCDTRLRFKSSTVKLTIIEITKPTVIISDRIKWSLYVLENVLDYTLLITENDYNDCIFSPFLSNPYEQVW